MKTADEFIEELKNIINSEMRQIENKELSRHAWAAFKYIKCLIEQFQSGENKAYRCENANCYYICLEDECFNKVTIKRNCPRCSSKMKIEKDMP
jgi:hypothetical protein